MPARPSSLPRRAALLAAVAGLAACSGSPGGSERLPDADTTPPSGSVVIDAGAGVTPSRVVSLALSATDAVGVALMRFSSDGATWSAGEPYATTRAWTLSSGDGPKTVWVRFGDAAGNWSAPASDGIVLDSTPPSISATDWHALTTTSVVVGWTTDEPATSQVEYGTTEGYGQLTASDDALVTSHALELTGLAGLAGYHFRARSRDAAGNLALGDDGVFATPDLTPPSAPADVVATVVSPTHVSISWTSSSDDVAVVGYDVVRDGTPVGSALAPPFEDGGAARGATQVYTVTARDAAGNTSAASAGAGATTPPLVVSGVVVASTTAASATLRWTTDVPATTRVEFGTSEAYGSASEDATPVTSHLRTLTGLPPGTVHHYRVASADGQGRQVVSPGGTFATKPPSAGVFQNEVLVSGMDLPTAVKFLPGGDMLVLELGGKIWRVPSGTTVPDPVPFLSIVNIGTANGQQGLMDMVLHPDFASRRWYYVFYTLGTPNRDRVSRFTATADLTGTEPGSEVVIYQDPLDASTEHHGGALVFGGDGKLLVTTGEHFAAAAAQSLASPRGKVLRFGDDGSVPLDNPFHDGAGPHYDAIWAYGLRNPYRATYDAPTGRYLIGDVGGNDYSYAAEEVNLGMAGANYGWPVCEGGGCGGNPAFTAPLFWYPHAGRDAAITGGFVYRGTQFPPEYVGSYFYADYTQNWIRRLTFDASGNPLGDLPFEPPDGAPDGPFGDIVYLAEGPDGALYYVDLGYSDVTQQTGISKIRRIRFVPGNEPPVAEASATPDGGPAPLRVQFSSAGSHDPEGGPVTFLWTFGDGSTSTEADPVHLYLQAGPYVARLAVSDGNTTTLSAPVDVAAGLRPVATITSPAAGLLFRAGDVLQISGEATDAEDGALPPSAFTWNVDFLHEGHVHPGLPVTGTRSLTFPVETSGHDYSGTTRYRITLTVTDSDGLVGRQSVVVFPDKVDLAFDTLPSGLTLLLDGISRITPFVHDTLKGFHHVIEAPDQTSGEDLCTFASWSDGGARQHEIVVPESNASFAATFDVGPIPQPPGLVGGWRLDEGAGTTTADLTGNAPDGTLVGGPAWTPGQRGSALSFSGTSYVDLGNPAALRLTGSMTLTAWIRIAADPSDDGAIVGKIAGSGWQLKTSPDTGARTAAIQIGNPAGGTVQRYGSTVLVPNAWYHLAGAYDATARTLHVYVNGALDDGVLFAAVPASQVDSTASAQIAQRAGFPGSFNFIGVIDEVHVFDRALTPAEISTDMSLRR